MNFLPRPCVYFPIERGKYEVAPGLKLLNQAVGNGPRDSLVFQLDSDFIRFRLNKLDARRERLSKYVTTDQLNARDERALNELLLNILVAEHPDRFKLGAAKADGSTRLACHLTGEILYLDRELRLTQVDSSVDPVDPPYNSTFDALACQIQEDLAFMKSDGSRNRVAALHLCSPNHWSAEDKIGRDFRAIHAPVAGIERINAAAEAFVDAMIHKGPYVRFAWGVATDDRLNHHPEPPAGISHSEWAGRDFSIGTQAGLDSKSETLAPNLWLRIERQTTVGLPTVQGALFTIRTYFLSSEEIAADSAKRTSIASAIRSMTPEQLRYKGLTKSRDEILSWLESDSKHAQ